VSIRPVYLLSHIVLHVSSVSALTVRMVAERSDCPFPLACPLVSNMIEIGDGDPLGFLKVKQTISLPTH
jgi:hypothetical protein